MASIRAAKRADVKGAVSRAEKDLYPVGRPASDYSSASHPPDVGTDWSSDAKAQYEWYDKPRAASDVRARDRDQDYNVRKNVEETTNWNRRWEDKDYTRRVARRGNRRR